MARPKKFKSTNEIQSLIDKYFSEAESSGRPLTVTGLCLALNTSRQTLLDYEADDEFSDTIKRAKLRIENWTEEQLFTSPRTAGVIFNLTNNFGWVNKQREGSKQTDMTGWADLLKEADKVLAEHGES